VTVRDRRPEGFWFHATLVGGATASGLRNPSSRTEALPRFRALLARVRPWQTILVGLGEVARRRADVRVPQAERTEPAG
jgi:hypothetical protein